MADQDIALMSHLLRRAGFSASRDEVETRPARPVDATRYSALGQRSRNDKPANSLARSSTPTNTAFKPRLRIH